MKKATTTMKKRKSGVEEGKGGGSPSQRIDARIKELSDWRGETLARIRALIKQADPEVVEEWKWVKPTNPGTPVWAHAGMICTGETYQNVVKMTFAKGASLEDPSGLFNSSLEGNPGAPGPSISMRATRLMKRRSRRSFAPPWH